MARDIVEIVGEYASEDPARWGRLASDVQWRRLQLLLLREILVELRRLNGECSTEEKPRPNPSLAPG